MTDITKTQIVGFGSAAVGLFITADRIGVLDDFLKQGLVIHEKSPSAQDWNSLAYHVNSNSPVSDFLFGIRPNGFFSPEFNTPTTSAWLIKEDASINLIEMSQFFKKLMLRIVRKIESSKTCEIRWGDTVKEVYMTKDRKFLVSDSNMNDVVVSQSLVLATGASNQAVNRQFSDTGDVIECDFVLRGEKDELIQDALTQGRKVIVLGGSHSGFSALGYILDRFGTMINGGQLHIVSRGSVIEMYDKFEAQAHVLKRKDTIHPATGDINRFSGLRRDARNIYRAIASGAEKRSTLHEIPGKYGPDVLLHRCGIPSNTRPILINATGYHPRIPTFFDQNGQEIPIEISNGNARKCELSGELYSYNRKVSRLYGTGLGFADIGLDGPQVGINFFNSSTSQRIIENILG